MAKDKITEYDATANNNTVVGDVNLAENSALPSDMNNALREIMSHQKEAFGSGTPLYVDQTNNRVGIGTTTEGYSSADDLTIATTGHTGITIRSSASHEGAIFFSDATSGTGEYAGYIQYNHSNDSLILASNATERLRVNSNGKILVNSSNATNGGFNPQMLIKQGADSGFISGLNIEGQTADTVLGLGYSSSSGAFEIASSYRSSAGYKPLDFQTNGATRMRLDISGRLLLGTTSAISSAGGAIFQQSQSNNNWTQYVENTASSGSVFGQLIKFTGQSPDNLTSAFLSCQDTTSTKFIVFSDGDAYNHDGTFAQLSDRRIKDNITDANSQWEDIKAMRFVNYQRKDDIRQYGESEAKVQLGLIGQELEKVSPNLVREVEPNASDILGSSEFGTLYENGDTIPEGKNIGDVKEVKDKVKGVAYSILYMKAVKALQEAMTRIEKLEARITTLEGA